MSLHNKTLPNKHYTHPVHVGGWLLASTFSIFLQTGLASESVLDQNAQGFQSLNGIYEPSGVVQLPDKRLLLVEDEPSRAFVVLTSDQHPPHFYDAEILQPRSLLTTLMMDFETTFNDLEAISQGPQNLIYAITSHSRQKSGSRSSQREKLIRMDVNGNRIGQLTARGDLRDALVNAFPILAPSARERDVKDNAGLNIEGLTFSRNADALWLGFRAPLLDDKAILITLTNPLDVFEADGEYQFAENLQLLDLDGGGIRDITFDPVLDGYLIVSQRENTKKEKAFKLWFWSGSAEDSTRRVRIHDIRNLRSTEGIAPIILGDEKLLLLVSDEGDMNSQKSAKALLVHYEDLHMD